MHAIWIIGIIHIMWIVYDIYIVQPFMRRNLSGGPQPDTL